MQKNYTVNIPPECFSADCPGRALFDQVADKWSMMVLVTLETGPVRFNAIKHRLEGVTQKALTQCLRKLERNGMLTRHVIATSLGHTLLIPLKAMHDWAMEKLPEVEVARHEFDQRDM